MKRLFIILFFFTLLLSISTAASAAYVDVEIGDGGDLILAGLSHYSVEALPSSFRLFPGDDPTEVDFFDVTFHGFDVRRGSATAIIDFDLPDIDVEGSGIYAGFITCFFQIGILHWNEDYIDIPFGDGGLMRLVLFDLAGINLFHPVTVSGSLELIQAPVPIPSAAWLLGSGILGLVGMRRKIK